MIDDFKVPSDERFGWDKYDDQREICLQHIDGTFGDNAVYFPNYPATDEGAVAAATRLTVRKGERVSDWQ
jgi:hypothetical protein